MRLLDRLASPRLLPLLLVAGVVAYGLAAALQEEALGLLLALIQRSRLLQLLLWLLPLSQLLRAGYCLAAWRRQRRHRQGPAVPLPAGYGETVTVAGRLTSTVAEQLALAGYRIAGAGPQLVAWRGISSFPLRAVGCLAVACLSGGLILSIAGREVRRAPLIAGEPLPAFLEEPGTVAAVAVQETPAGRLFARRLTVRVSRPDGSVRQVPMFPASRFGEWWYYPRFLGLAPLISFSVANPAVAQEDFHLLAIYPAGREDIARIPGTPFRVLARLAEREGEQGPEALQLRVMQNDTLLGAGTVAPGGSLAFSGGRLAIGEMRQFVTADFVRDAGLPLIWCGLWAGFLALLAGLTVWLVNPRRELVVRQLGDGQVCCWSMAEGRGRGHRELFHSVLDRISLH